MVQIKIDWERVAYWFGGFMLKILFAVVFFGVQMCLFMLLYPDETEAEAVRRSLILYGIVTTLRYLLTNPTEKPKEEKV
jgi:hypothetical protein